MWRKFKFHENRARIKGLYVKTNVLFFIISPSFLLRMRNVSDKSCRGNQSTHFVVSIFFRKSYRLWDNLEKYCRAGQATWQYGAFVLHAGYLRLQIHTLGLCNTHCFSTAAMVARTSLTIALYVNCLVL